MAGGRLEDIRTLVLSHLHADHASLAGEFVERTGCELLRFEGPDTNIDRLREPTIDRAERARLARAHGIPEHALEAMIDMPLADDGLQPRPPADALLRAGDTVAGWEVVPATGHSPNQLALWDGTRVIGADAAYPGLAPYLEWGHTPDPIAEYLATLDRLEALRRPASSPATARPDDDPRRALRRGSRGRRRDGRARSRRRARATRGRSRCRLTGDARTPSRGRPGSRACSASTEESDEVGGGDRERRFRPGGGAGRGQRRREGDGLRARAEGRRDDGAVRRQRLDVRATTGCPTTRPSSG